MRCPIFVHLSSRCVDRPAQQRSLVSAFVVRYMDCMIALQSMPEVATLQLVCVPTHAGFCLTWSNTGFLV